MKIILANPRGFCAGVTRALNIVEHAIKIFGSPIFVRHELVHNSFVTNYLSQKGVIFVENVDQVPDNSVLIFSAHGVSKKIFIDVKKRKSITLFNATCPLVTKIHMEVARASKKGSEVILIGHRNHPEIDGTMGQYDNINGGIYLVETKQDISKLKIKNPNNLYYMTQTTLSIHDTADIIHALYKIFPKILGPHKTDICYATINRQSVMYDLAKLTDLILIIGSKNSSNSNRLFELSQKIAKSSKLIDSVHDIKKKSLININCLGITAGASVPEILVHQVVQFCKQNFKVQSIVELNGIIENMNFKLPKELI